MDDLSNQLLNLAAGPVILISRIEWHRGIRGAIEHGMARLNPHLTQLEQNELIWSAPEIGAGQPGLHGDDRAVGGAGYAGFADEQRGGDHRRHADRAIDVALVEFLDGHGDGHPEIGEARQPDDDSGRGAGIVDIDRHGLGLAIRYARRTRSWRGAAPTCWMPQSRWCRAGSRLTQRRARAFQRHWLAWRSRPR